jgi:hypothetical protein
MRLSRSFSARLATAVEIGARRFGLGGRLAHPVQVRPRLGLAARRRLLLDLLGHRAGGEDLHVAAAVTVYGDALAPELVREPVDLLHVRLGGIIGKVAGLRDGGVVVLLEGSLHADVPLRLDLVGRDEHALPLGGHLGEPDVARLGDPLHQLLGVPALALRDRHELLVHVRHQHAGLVTHERHGE